ncbi:MAG TPA: adenylyltransferase/cytidyltransferase family protein [Candidatus Paceibacterota bacterium]|nr:adenylyltransferase/cytidyltransferase family protein [Candidatus Paceibacterota bacterium]HRU20983.1 adenylyltransferase/cytidyltransferase family protein [Candidatus Paceibacterota bacterium]
MARPQNNKNKNNNKKQKKEIVVAVSGGFDPVHIGHVRLFKEAKALGDKLVVILNNDNWLKKKKGYVFMLQKERKELIENFKWVDKVILTSHKPNPIDMSVSKELAKLKPDIFANGGDRKKGNTPETEVCQKYGIQPIFNVGKGGKIQSSSWLLEKYKKNTQKLKQ